MKARPGDWRRGWAVYYKGGGGGGGRGGEGGSPNPSMFALVKDFEGARSLAQPPAARSVRAADAMSGAARRPAASAARRAAAPRRCSDDAQCAALAPAGRSAVCLDAGSEGRHCYEGEGAWLSRLTPRRSHPAQLFDGFLFNNEFDLLELRLQAITFQNDAKPLYFEECVAAHPARFAPWMDRMENIKIDGRPRTPARRSQMPLFFLNENGRY